MRTTIEMPDEVLMRAKVRAARDGISLRHFFIEAVEQRLALPSRKVRREPPVIGSKAGLPIRDLTSTQIDETAFGRRRLRSRTS
jgi:hypothetical protein